MMRSTWVSWSLEAFMPCSLIPTRRSLSMRFSMRSFHWLLMVPSMDSASTIRWVFLSISSSAEERSLSVSDSSS